MSSFTSRPDRHAPLIRSVSGPIAGLFLLGFPTYWLPPKAELETCALLTEPLCQCLLDILLAECHFLQQVIDFQDPPRPDVLTLRQRDLGIVTAIWRFERVLCAAVCDANGEIAGMRDYASVEQTRLFAAHREMQRKIQTLMQRLA